jgi:hypothetical protein
LVDNHNEIRQLKETIAAAALAIFASAARLRRKGEITESQELERLAIDLQDIVANRRRRNADDGH